jgi:hypothetical protein
MGAIMVLCLQIATSAPVPKDKGLDLPPTDPKNLKLALAVTNTYDPDTDTELLNSQILIKLYNETDKVLEVGELYAYSNDLLATTGLTLVVRFGNGNTVECVTTGHDRVGKTHPLVLPRSGGILSAQTTFDAIGGHTHFRDEFKNCKKFSVTAIIRKGDLKLKSNTCKVNRYDDKTEYDPFDDADTYHQRIRVRPK